MSADRKMGINRPLIWALLVGVMAIVFTHGAMRDHGKVFQWDSEELVLHKIAWDRAGGGSTPYGLLRLSESAPMQKLDYASSFGLQGYAYSYLANQYSGFTGTRLRLINSGLTTVVVGWLIYMIMRKYGGLIGLCFYGGFVLSPWIVAFAPNLYWVEFTWFLPAVLVLMMLKNVQSGNPHWYFYPLLFASILIKSLCGYEYLSTILMFAMGFVIFDIVDSRSWQARITLIKVAILTAVSLLSGFIGAILLHASLRGINMVDGLTRIWNQDVLRRTFGGNPQNFDPSYTESLLVSPIQVVGRYVFHFPKVLVGIHEVNLLTVGVGVLVMIAVEYFRTRKFSVLDTVMAVYFLLTTLSWIVLAKSHSYIHTHINYVVWYFGFVQMVIYIAVKFIWGHFGDRMGESDTACPSLSRSEIQS